MKYTLATLLLLFPILVGAACDQATPLPADGNRTYIDENTDSMSDTLVIKVGGKAFSATLLDNPTATEFKAMLPLTINMSDLNGNEKKYDFSKDSPINDYKPEKINNGDLMICVAILWCCSTKHFPRHTAIQCLGVLMMLLD